MRTHYDVLGVAPDASGEAIRAAYRQRARDHHPDRHRSSSAVGGDTMPAINEAYRVLHDPGRRAMYDRSIEGRRPVTSSPTGPAAAAEPTTTWDASQMAAYRHHGPARVPWRSMLVAATVGTIGVVGLAQFTDGGGDVGPDGILRNGDCVEVEPDNDAREIACTGDGDLVVRAFIPFDGTCPGRTEPHRDRQGMGVACVELSE